MARMAVGYLEVQKTLGTKNHVQCLSASNSLHVEGIKPHVEIAL